MKKKKKTPMSQALESMIDDTEKNEYEKVKKKPALTIAIALDKKKK